jgi:hypothetical protein
MSNEQYTIVTVLGEPYASYFWKKVQKTATCWLWTAAKGSSGYGKFCLTIQGQGRCIQLTAHRLAYEMVYGRIPCGLELDHLCRVRACVNPAHLEPVTCRENLARSPLTIPSRFANGEGVPNYNAMKTHCWRGHVLSGDNLYIRPKTGYRQCRECMRMHDRQRKDHKTRYARKWRLLKKAQSTFSIQKTP